MTPPFRSLVSLLLPLLVLLSSHAWAANPPPSGTDDTTSRSFQDCAALSLLREASDGPTLFELCMKGEPLPAVTVQRVASRTNWNSIVLLDAMVPLEGKSQEQREGEVSAALLEQQHAHTRWIASDVLEGKKPACDDVRQAFVAAATAEDAGEALPPMLLDEPSPQCLPEALRDASSSYRYITAFTDGLTSVAVLTVVNGAYTARRIEAKDFLKVPPAPPPTRRFASRAPEAPSRRFIVVPVPRGAVVTLLGDAEGLPQPDVWQGVIDTDVLVWASRPERRCIYLEALTEKDQTVLLDGRPVGTGTVLVAPGSHWLAAGRCGETSCRAPQYYKIPASDIDIAPGANCAELVIDFRPAKNVTVLTPSIGRTCPVIWGADVEEAATQVLEQKFRLENQAMNDIAEFSAALSRLAQSLDEGDAHDEGPTRTDKEPSSLSKVSTTLWREGLSEVYQLEVVCRSGTAGYRVIGRRWDLSKVRDEARDARFIRDFPVRATQEFTDARDLKAAVRSTIHELRGEPFLEILRAPELYQRTSVRPMEVRLLARGVNRDEIEGMLKPAGSVVGGGPCKDAPRRLERLKGVFESKKEFRFTVSSRYRATDSNRPVVYSLKGNPPPGLYVASFETKGGVVAEECVEVYAGQFALGVEMRVGAARSPKDTISNRNLNLEVLGVLGPEPGARWFAHGLVGYSYAQTTLRTPTSLPSIGSDLSRYDPLGRSTAQVRRHGLVMGGRVGTRIDPLSIRNFAASSALEALVRVPLGNRGIAGRLGLNFGYDVPLNSIRLSLYWFVHWLVGPYAAPHHRSSVVGGGSLGVSWSVDSKYRRRRN